MPFNKKKTDPNETAGFTPEAVEVEERRKANHGVIKNELLLRGKVEPESGQNAFVVGTLAEVSEWLGVPIEDVQVVAAELNIVEEAFHPEAHAHPDEKPKQPKPQDMSRAPETEKQAVMKDHIEWYCHKFEQDGQLVDGKYLPGGTYSQIAAELNVAHAEVRAAAHNLGIYEEVGG